MSIDSIKGYIKEHSKLFLFLGILCYVILFSFLSLKKYYNFDYNAIDLAIFNQVFFNTLHGHWFALTINLNIYLADHFTPIIFLLLPFYALGQSATTLLILQSIILGLSAYPLYLISKYISRDNLVALTVASMWLLSPFVHSVNVFEFHLMPLAVFLIFWTFYFYKKENYKLFLLFFILALLVREDISLILLAFPLLAWLDKRSLKWKLPTFLLAIIYLVVALNIIKHFSVTGDYKFFIYYGWLGGHGVLAIIHNWIMHPLDVLFHLVRLRNWTTAIILFLPMLALPLLRPKYLLLSLFPVLQFIFTFSGMRFTSYSTHYVLFFLPGLFIALIFALDKLKKRQPFKYSKYIYNNFNFLKVVLFLAVLYFVLFFSPLFYILRQKHDKDYTDSRHQFVNQIPKEASVAAEGLFLPSLSSRQFIYPVDYSFFAKGQFARVDFVLPPVDYILMDYSEFLHTLTEKRGNSLFTDEMKKKMPGNWRNILNNYNLIKAENNLFLWRNKSQSEDTDLKLYEIEPKPEGFIDNNFIVKSELSEGKVRRLKLTFQKHYQQENYYLVRFYKGEDYFDVPLDYGMFPETEWPKDDLISFFYYLDAKVDAYQLFSWEGSNMLDLNKSIISQLKLSELSEKINI